MARRWRGVALGATLLAGVPVARAAPSAMAADGACDGDSGVTVVVDFGTLGGGMQTRCAPEPVSTGFDALTRAGFTYAGTTRFPGLLCRIDGKPSPQQDACQNAPSPRYYWAYWTAPAPGGAWTYSDQGAGNRDPAPGSVEGWAFSDGCTRQPGAPSSCATTTTTSTPAATPTTRPAASGGAPGGPGGGSSAATSNASSGTTTDLGADQSAALGGTEATEGGAAPPSEELERTATDGEEVALGGDQDAAAADPSAAGSGSPAGVLAGAVAVLLLALGAAGRQRQRRRSSTSGPGAE